MYTHPPDPSILGIMQKALTNAEPNQAEALKVLKKHANELPTVEAIKLLPDDYSLKSVWAALEAILQSTRDKRTSLEMRKAVCTAALAQCEQRLSVIQSVKVSIDNSSECSVCGKKISSTAFARHANGRLEHFHCYQRRNISDSQTSLK
ncbi:hypothetical protein AB6A40_005508 [Gnathostoma spinigerum]|uniref:Vacuolar sorting protein 39/Transforming growth factor beta receptor-associated zinc finger domain-containing protein n=1 Tax=Gnathostoma spinigerum TaxID=75299 RepID=A0ABD6ENA1_9BILA